MDKPVYEGHEFDVLQTRYSEQAAYIRDLNQYELRVFGGFVTIQLLLASFFSLHSIESNLAKCGVLIADASICFICVQILIAIRARRKEITDTIININKAFGLYKSGIYLSDQAINPPVARRRFVWLDIGCYVAFAGFVIALFAPFVTLGGK